MSYRIIVTRESAQRTQRQLERIYERTRRRSIRKGVRQAGSQTLKAARRAAPRGRTGGQFRRSLRQKNQSYARNDFYVSMVGQDWTRRSTQKQIANAARRTGRISTGLSGRGKEPAIHWIESGTSQHAIRPQSARMLYWNIRKGDVRVPIEFAPRVTHPGHAGTGFMRKTERRMRQQNALHVVNTVQRDIVAQARSAL